MSTHHTATITTTAPADASLRRRRTGVAFGITAAVFCTALTAVVSDHPAHAQPTLAQATFDPSSTGWLFYSEQSADEFDDTFDQLAKSGQMLFDFDIDTDPKYRVGTIYRPNPDGRGWAMLPDRTGAEFNADAATYKAGGYRMSGVESYRLDGSQRYATHFVENVEGLDWAAHYGLDGDELRNEYDRYRRTMLPVDFDGYATKTGLEYGVVWEENVENLSWKLRWGMTNDQLQLWADTYMAQGYRFLVLDSYPVGSGHRHAAIWVDNTNGRGHAAWADMTATDFGNKWNLMNDMGFRLDDYETYTSKGAVRYNGVWRQNDDKYDWKVRTRVDDEIDDFRTKFDIPGVGVSITHQGNIVYERGFGFQDVDAGAEYHANTVNRLASVSKAITGILAFDVLSDYPAVSFTDDVDTYLNWLPAHHTYQLGDTLTNLSCLASYPDPMTVNWTEDYDSASEAVTDFMDAPLVTDADDGSPCGSGAAKYSTAAYTVACAVFEWIEGKTIDDIIADRLTTAHDLPTLTPDDDGVAHRTVLYDDDNSELAPDNVSWKTCGGGLQASVHDMARLGIELLDGQILSATDREDMWALQGSWAYGWNVGSAANAGERWVGKSGAQPGARTYWLVYPDDDITITVLTNRWGGGHSPSTLAHGLGEVLLGVL